MDYLEAKKNYIINETTQLADSRTAPKSYWVLLSCFPYNRKIPVLLLDGKLPYDFYEKGNILNNFFASICTPIKIASPLSSFSCKTNTRIKSCCFSEKDILLII